jgi:hypothetical protein
MERKSKAPGKSKGLSPSYHALHPWRWQARGDQCELVAYVEASGKWETVATILRTSSASAESLANFIVGVVNDVREDNDAVHGAFRALESLMNEGLTFTIEQEAASAVERLRQRGFLP